MSHFFSLSWSLGSRERPSRYVFICLSFIEYIALIIYDVCHECLTIAGNGRRKVSTVGASEGKREYASKDTSGAPPVEFKHRQYLLALAKANMLPRLLEDDGKMREMGIPRAEYERLMRKPENHGMKGFEPAKHLLYVRKGEEIESNVPYKAAIRSPDRSRVPPQPVKKEGKREEEAESSLTMPSSIMDMLESQYGISLPEQIKKTVMGTTGQTQEHRVICPRCDGGSSKERSFSISFDKDRKSAKWHCFRATCGFSGTCHVGRPSVLNKSGFIVSPVKKRKEEAPVRPVVELESLSSEMVKFFQARGISEATLARNKISSQMVYDPMKKEKSKVIAFPYYTHDLLINIKYRTLDKRFWQVKGAEKVLYGLNDIVDSSEIIIVEGEMDKLALEEAGMTNVVSVPDGAPARVKEGALPTAEDDTKYSYLWNSRAWVDQAVRIVIATDNDAPGDALAEELARRLGRERCWRVRWPFNKEDHDFVATSFGDNSNLADSQIEKEQDKEGVDPAWYRKDANEVLLKDGPEMLRNFIESAEPLPIRGLLRFHEYYEDILKYYYLELKDGQGVKTGWPSLDNYYRVVPGELTIVTGVPNSGKSEWIDALLCNLSEQHGWQFAMCSMEKRATDHARQLAEKYVGKPFFDLPYSRGTTRMTYEELDEALDWVDDRFHLIRYEDDELPSVDWVLDVAKAAVYRYGIRGLVIDPYNELDHQRPSSMSETEYVSKMLTKVKRFAQTAGVHVWFVAHPRQLHQWKGEAPNLYDISGSAHFINKADNGIVVHRNRDPDSDSADSVEILVRKVRNKAAGTIGSCSLTYDRRNGRYLDSNVVSMYTPKTSAPIQTAEYSTGFGYFVNEDGTVEGQGL